MTSIKTQLPYEYYSLPFCRPVEKIHYKKLNLGTHIDLHIHKNSHAIVQEAYLLIYGPARSLLCIVICSETPFLYSIPYLLLFIIIHSSPLLVPPYAGEVLRGDRIVDTPYMVSCLLSLIIFLCGLLYEGGVF